MHAGVFVGYTIPNELRGGKIHSHRIGSSDTVDGIKDLSAVSTVAPVRRSCRGCVRIAKGIGDGGAIVLSQIR